MRNPNKYLRLAYITALEADTGLSVYDKVIPKDLPFDTSYILITSQTKTRYAISKTCYEWLVVVNTEVVCVNEKGYISTLKVDDVEEGVLNSVQGITVPGWSLKSKDLLDSVDADLETPTHTINRRIITHEYWLSEL